MGLQRGKETREDRATCKAGRSRITSGGEPPSLICRVSLAWLPVFLTGMNPRTCSALQTLTCGVEHDVELIEDDGTLFLESEAVQFHKMKHDANLPESERLHVSRQVSKTSGVPLEPVHDPKDVECLRSAKPGDWPKVLRLLQNWGWGGNTVLMSNGNNGASHDKSYFDRTLVCTFWRKHRSHGREDRMVYMLLVTMPSR